MCGIFFHLSNHPIRGKDKSKLFKRFQKISHRGPDESAVCYYGLHAMMGFHRLQIVDPTHAGMQPFHSDGERYASAINGEIYNFKSISAILGECPICKFAPKSDSDCEVVLALFLHILHETQSPRKAMEKLCQQLDGEYAVIIYDTLTEEVCFGVDELRIRPLFYAFGEKGDFYLSSEQKALSSLETIAPVPSGKFGLLSRGGDGLKLEMEAHFDFDFYRNLSAFESISYNEAAHKLRELLLANMSRKLNPEREFAFMLSGGLDSSLVCAMAKQLISPRRIRTFTFGFSKGAPDVVAAEKMAKHLDSIHETFLFGFEEGASLVEETVYYAESWDQTTTRASVAMLLGLKEIKRRHPEIAVLYSGEVADELLRGYLYNLDSPSAAEGRLEAIDRLENITYFDGLRADRMVSRVSCELRLPFFGKDLLRFVLTLPPVFLDAQSQGGVEKRLLRDAFDAGLDGEALNLLPKAVLWRTKHALSDATSEKSAWRECLGREAARQTTMSRFAACGKLYAHCPPATREDFWYREMFDLHGFSAEAVPFKWLPSWQNSALEDSSATVLGVFHED